MYFFLSKLKVGNVWTLNLVWNRFNKQNLQTFSHQVLDLDFRVRVKFRVRTHVLKS